MKDPIVKSSGNIFLDLGFRPRVGGLKSIQKQRPLLLLLILRRKNER
jgi:hypothetical protein